MRGPLESVDDTVPPVTGHPSRGVAPGAQGEAADPGSRLRASLDEIVQALAVVRKPGTATPTRGQDVETLLRRARALAEELRQVVGELLGEAAEGVMTTDRRRLQLRVPLVAAVERAAAEIHEHLGGRHVSIACPDRLCVQSDPDRLHELLVELLRDAARRPGEIHLLVQRQRSELLFTVSGIGAGCSGTELGRIQSLARRLGGHIDVVGHPEPEAALRVRLPQQRTADPAPSA